MELYKILVFRVYVIVVLIIFLLDIIMFVFLLLLECMFFEVNEFIIFVDKLYNL